MTNRRLYCEKLVCMFFDFLQVFNKEIFAFDPVDSKWKSLLYVMRMVSDTKINPSAVFPAIANMCHKLLYCKRQIFVGLGMYARHSPTNQNKYQNRSFHFPIAIKVHCSCQHSHLHRIAYCLRTYFRLLPTETFSR